MAINPVNIVPDVTQVTIITDDKKLVISGDVVANNVNVSQPIVNTIKVQVPGPQGPVGPIGPEPSTGSLIVTGSVSNNTLTFTKGDGSTFDLTPNSGSFSGSFEGAFIRGRIGDGVIIEEGSTIIRSEGFLGQTSASLGLSPAGFVIYSGSSTTTLGADTLQGTGFKFVGPNNISSISFTDQNQGDVEIKTDKFTLQNSGDITASNALFSGTAIAQNFLQKSVVIHDTVFEGNPSNFNNYFDQATLASYNLVLDGGRGGEILNNVEFKLDESDIILDDIILLGDETLTEDKAQVTLRVRSDSARGLFFNLRKPDGSSFDQILSPGNIYTFEISYDKGGTKTTTALAATDLSIPVTTSPNGYRIQGNVYATNFYGTSSYASYAVSASHEITKEVSSSFADTASYVNPLNQDVQITGSLSILGDASAALVSSPVVSFTNNIDKDITTESGSHAVSMGDITIDSGSSTNIGGTWDILDSYFFTQASNKQIYGLLFDFDGAINLSILVGQNLWKNNSTAERWYNNAYQWDPNEVDSSQRGRVKIKVGLTYDKDGGNAYVRLTDVRDGVKTYLGDDWYQLTTSNPSSPIFTEFEFEGIDGAGTPFTPGGIDRYLALESFTESGIFLGLYKADVKLTVY